MSWYKRLQAGYLSDPKAWQRIYEELVEEYRLLGRGGTPSNPEVQHRMKEEMFDSAYGPPVVNV